MFSSLAQMLFKVGVSSVGPGRDSGPHSLPDALLAILWNSGRSRRPGLIRVRDAHLARRALASTAFPGLSFCGLSFVLTAAFGYLVFRDDMGALRVFGILLIVAGVCLVGKS